MAHISGHLVISAPATRVFDTVADSRNEPSYNPAMHDVELLTPLPIGPGSRFLARMGRNDLELGVELTEFDRPHRLGLAHDELDDDDQRRADLRGPGRRHPAAVGLAGAPRGWLRVLGPLVGPLGRRMERRTWAGLKQHLEDAP